MQAEDRPTAGKSTMSRQYQEPTLRVSKTYQDSNIFGYKDTGSNTLTDEAKNWNLRQSMQRKSLANKSEIGELFAQDDKAARDRLRKTNDSAFQPKFERISPTKRYATEFHGEQYADQAEVKVATKPQLQAARSIVLPAENAQEIKINALQSNIFLDVSKETQLQSNRIRDTPERLLSAKSKWDSQSSAKKTCNLKQAEDLSNEQKTNFARNKKRQDMRSDIFNVSQPEDAKIAHDFEAKEPSAKQDYADRNNEDIKKTQHLFSNILSHEDKTYTYNKENKNQGDPFIATNLKWNDSRTENISPKKVEANSPNDKKMAHLASSVESTLNKETISPVKSTAQPIISEKTLERELLQTMSPQQKKGFEMKSEVPLGETSQSWAHNKQPSNESAMTFDFDLKSIPKGMDMDTLKKAFSGFHVVDLKADRNNVNGAQVGTGRVKIRATSGHDMLKLKHDLKQHGILMLSHFEKHTKKNNYRDLAKINWHDQYLQNEEGRIKSGFSNAKESKLQNLESEGDVFGNTKGVGKWDRQEVAKVNQKNNEFEQKSPEDLVRTHNWQKSISKVPNTRPSSASSMPKKTTPKPTKPFK